MEDYGSDAQSLEFSRYAAVIRRRWPMIPIGLVVGVLLGAAYGYLAPREVTATTTVNINVITNSMFGGDRAPSALVDPQTEQQLGRSSRVLANAIEALGIDASVGDVRERTTITPVPSSTVVKVAFRAATEAEAVETSDAIAHAYLQFRQSQAQERVDQNLKNLTERRDALRADLIKAKTTLSNAEPGSEAAVRAASDAELLGAEINALVARMNDSDRVDTLGGVLISKAADSPLVYSPSRVVALGSGLLGGALIGVVLAFVVQGLDRRVYDRSAVARAGGGVVLAELRGRDGVIPAVGSDADEIRALCEQLLSVYPPDLVISVRDLTSDDRAGDVGVNVADGFARMGRIVHLILVEHDATFVAHVRSQLGLRDEVGETATSIARSAKRQRLRVSITSLSDGDSGADGRGFTSLIKAVPGAVVVIALPPDPARSVRLAATRNSHTTVLVASLRGTRHAEIVGVASELWAVDARVYGTILVPAHRRIAALSGSDHGHAHGRGRIEEGARKPRRAPAVATVRGSQSAEPEERSVGAEEPEGTGDWPESELGDTDAAARGRHFTPESA